MTLQDEKVVLLPKGSLKSWVLSFAQRKQVWVFFLVKQMSKHLEILEHATAMKTNFKQSNFVFQLPFKLPT